MRSAIAQADMIGAVGIGRGSALSTEEKAAEFARRIPESLRGFAGHWQAMDLLLQAASRNDLKGKVLAPAHLYFSVIERLDDITAKCNKVMIISDRESVFIKFRLRYPEVTASFLQVGVNTLPSNEHFLDRVSRELPNNLEGTLCLVGAGIWSEIYCSWIKQRGGVAVDLGSGMDLLDGCTSRPAHKGSYKERLSRIRL
jgi:hypothetical protein